MQDVGPAVVILNSPNQGANHHVPMPLSTKTLDDAIGGPQGPWLEIRADMGDACGGTVINTHLIAVSVKTALPQLPQAFFSSGKSKDGGHGNGQPADRVAGGPQTPGPCMVGAEAQGPAGLTTTALTLFVANRLPKLMGKGLPVRGQGVGVTTDVGLDPQPEVSACRKNGDAASFEP